MKRRRLELPRHNWHYPLKVARLPIPPPLQLCFAVLSLVVRAQNRTRTCTSWNTRTWNERVYHSATWAWESSWAENETRTRDPNLGKVVLYQLSYFRKISEEEETRTPTSQLTLPPQSSASTNSATSPVYFVCFLFLWFVPRTGLEPARRETLAPETSASTIPPPGQGKVERKTRLELATPTLARLCSTNWAISANRFQKGMCFFLKCECKGTLFYRMGKRNP